MAGRNSIFTIATTNCNFNDGIYVTIMSNSENGLVLHNIPLPVKTFNSFSKDACPLPPPPCSSSNSYGIHIRWMSLIYPYTIIALKKQTVLFPEQERHEIVQRYSLLFYRSGSIKSGKGALWKQ
jgi:hypothetical protein